MPPRRGGPPTRGRPPPVGAGQRGGPPSRGGGPGGQLIAAHVKTVGVRRPDYGTAGQANEVFVNAFPVTTPDGNIFHYDVAITPDNLPARMNMKLFHKLYSEVAKQTAFREAVPVYDGKKNAYTMKRLPFDDSASFDVPYGATRGDRPPKIYKIKVTIARVINTQILDGYINGTQSIDNDVYTAIAALNVAIRMLPNQEHTFNTRSFFVPNGSRPIGKGLELWRGYFQSIRPTFGGMYVNLDIATGVMVRPGRLVDIALEFFNQRPGTNPDSVLGAKRIPDRERLRLQRFLANVRFKTTYPPNREYSIKKLTSQGADNHTFKLRDGRSITVANYFRTELNRPLKFPSLLCVEVGSGAAIPMELCDVGPGQIMRKQIPQDKMADVVEFSKMRPDQRLSQIRGAFQVLKYTTSAYVREFGMSISEDPLSVPARTLQPPTLKYGKGRQPTIRPMDGAWNMRDKQFFRPAAFKTWIVVVYEPRSRFEAVVPELITSVVTAARSVGMSVGDTQPLVAYHNGQGDIDRQLRAFGAECMQVKKSLPDFILVVLPEGGNDIYTAVKHFGDVATGVATQCVKAMKARKANMQYWANVMLKLNAKLGGINCVLDQSPLSDAAQPTIVMGADAVHPPPGTSDKPSFAALVSSVDSTTAKYISAIRVQTGRQELIEDLEGMCTVALEKWKSYQAFEGNKKPPARLIFYRDGVSEGQFEQVLQDELPKIQAACSKLGIKPKITLIIVGKRHHIRMFPKSPNGADKSGNCKAGTTIDRGIGHPTEHDYYQLSHGGLLGTSRPSHYSVIYDENNFPADTMQNISFALCHVYARATRSVSIPAPVYYADIVCARAKTHFTPGGAFDLSETATQTTAQGSSYLESFKSAFKPLHNNQAPRMYFM